MRTILILWALPIVIFWGWYGLSAYDIHFGLNFLTRAFHDQLFVIYGNIMHLPPEDVPWALAWLFTVDTLILFGVAALRWYKKWLPQSWNWLSGKYNQVKVLFVPEQQVEEASEYGVIYKEMHSVIDKPVAMQSASGPAHLAE